MILLSKSPVRENRESRKAGRIIRLQCKSDSRWKREEDSILDYHTILGRFDKLLRSPHTKLNNPGVLLLQEWACLSIPDTVPNREQLMENIASEQTQAMNFSSWDLWSMKLSVASGLSGTFSWPSQGNLSGALHSLQCHHTVRKLAGSENDINIWRKRIQRESRR